MKLPVCSVCQFTYNEEERVPLMLQCGHCFCKECLAQMFARCTDHTLLCPRCRQPTKVGNSVEALHKNFGMLSLIRRAPSECRADEDSDEEEDEQDDVDEWLGGGGGIYGSSRLAASPRWSSASCSGIPVDLGSHIMRLVKPLGTGPRAGQDVWSGTLSGPGGCRHKVAVKRIDAAAGMELEWVQAKIENLRRAAMWCHNVCAVYGACKKDGKLCIVMDRYQNSVQSMMQQNEGRLTLEQILRYGADISRGVAELQAAGIVCLNLKPSNFLLDAKGRAVVSDYGIPDVLKRPNCKKGRGTGNDEETPSGHFCMECAMLNPCYLAPEAWEPLRKTTINLFWDDGNGVSAESDAWSFGCSLVEMCTGAKPWAGSSQDDIYKAVVKSKRLPPQYNVVGSGIPRELWKMIGDCLQFKGSKRPNFHAMLAMFLRHLREMPSSPPASPDNDLAKSSGGTEPSPSSTLDFSEVNHTYLHQLVSEGNEDRVRELLAKAATGRSIRALLESHNSDGQTVLHIAAMRGYSSIIELICSYEEADVEILDKDGDTPLVCAVASGTPEVLKALIRKGANVNARLKDGLGPSVAHVCAFYGQPDCMRELLLAGADPLAIGDDGDSVLYQAVARRNTDCAVVILENGGCSSMAYRNAENFTPLHMCVLTANVAVVRKWVEIASIEDIENAIEIPSPLGTALCLASSLKKAHEEEARELVRLFLYAGANGDAMDPEQGQTALHVAVAANDVEMVKTILDAGVSIDVCNAQGSTPLQIALTKGSKQCVHLLLDRDASCTIQDENGNTALHIAAEMAKMVRENLDWIVIMLNKSDAATDIKNHSGKTLRDLLEALPREWISEDLMDALDEKQIQLSPTVFDVGDWVKFRRTISSPRYGWGSTRPSSVGFVQNIIDGTTLLVSFCSGEAKVAVDEVVKLIPLDRGHSVRLKSTVKQPRFGWRGQSRESIGTVLCVDDDGILRIGFPGASRGWKADPAEMERVEEFKVGDWVRIRLTLTSAKYGLGSVTPGSIGVVHSIRPDNSLLIDFTYLTSPWHCEPEEVERVEPFKVGDRICVKRSVAEPKFAWNGESHHSIGMISEIASNGLLLVDLPSRSTNWEADPSDVEIIEDFKVGDWVRIRACVCSPKFGWEDINRASVGVVFYLHQCDMGVGFAHRSKAYTCAITDVEKVTPFEVGQEVRIAPGISEPRLDWSGETSASKGRISRIDMDGTLNVKVANRTTMWLVAPGDAERLSGYEVGDWVRLNLPTGLKPSYDWHGSISESVAVVHSVSDSGYLELSGCFKSGRWMAHYTEVEKVQVLRVGQHVRFRPGISEPRWGWRGCTASSRGVIIGVHADGELRIAFPGLKTPWRGDPADLEKEEIFEVGDWVKVKDDLQETKYGWKGARPGSVGIVQGIGYENGGDYDERALLVGFCGEQERWIGLPSEVERAMPLKASQRIRVKASVSQPRFGWSGHDHSTITTITTVDADGKLRVYSPASQRSWVLDPTEVELYEEQPICIGDWVRVKPSVPTPTHQWGEVTHKSIGVVHKITDDGDLRVAFCFLERLWVCKPGEMERVEAFRMGDRVQIKHSVVTPRWGWGNETLASRGVVYGVDADGRLRIQFARREGRLWIGDPADVELEQGGATTTT
ncbi:E3 ubiquitin-protein ligase KEG isoform X2 [Selaginella moellendorffii]|uniref:E3 ubiquitin-protein ligase KEG isoform X2 n=1 Tax=Selaginella moellendorffii TaxID=88036 RepID=UPI000D1CBB1C|nr:E3 ubiquitin-protein ligase KEG isoform X2 [Selaginella moellendorffii]|eukprot:XP_024545688.1 E3 ubiquitin-protein ligase KEG isoform X2 [Selaginella moellendorffii]